LKEFAGSKLPFAPTKAARTATKDPRSSIEERYRDRAEYERLVREVTTKLVADRFVLADDEEFAVASALSAYDGAIAN
jgi:hypothetical protein